MPKEQVPTNPTEAYQALIDELVDETSHGVSEALVKEDCIYSKAIGQGPANSLVKSLSAEQRKILAGMLHEERTGAIHDVLAVLTWWFECRDVAMTFHGQPMTSDFSGMGLHGDYIGRLGGWQWPKTKSGV